jgi:hypothetical protein
MSTAPLSIATLNFGGSIRTLGLSVVINSIRKRWPAATVGPATLARLREARYLLVTLTWWKDCYEYV